MHFYLANLPEHNEAELAALNEFRGWLSNPKSQCYTDFLDDKGWFIGAGAGSIPGLAFFRRMANKTPPKPILGGVVGATTIMLGSWLGGGYTNTFGTQEKIKTAIQNGEWERKFPEDLVHKNNSLG